MKTRFFKVAGQTQAQADATRAMNARAYNEGYIDSTADAAGSVAGATAGLAARRFLSRFVVAAAETTAEGLTATAGTAGAIGLTVVAPIAIGLLVSMGVTGGVKAAGKFALNRRKGTNLAEQVAAGTIEPLVTEEQIKAAMDDETIVPVSKPVNGNHMAKAMDVALAARQAKATGTAAPAAAAPAQAE